MVRPTLRSSVIALSSLHLPVIVLFSDVSDLMRTEACSESAAVRGTVAVALTAGERTAQSTSSA